MSCAFVHLPSHFHPTTFASALGAAEAATGTTTRCPVVGLSPTRTWAASSAVLAAAAVAECPPAPAAAPISKGGARPAGPVPGAEKPTSREGTSVPAADTPLSRLGNSVRAAEMHPPTPIWSAREVFILAAP